MRLVLISDGTVAGTRIVGLLDTDGAEVPIAGVVGFTLIKPDDGEGDRLLLNVAVRIDDEPELEHVHPLDMMA